MDPDGILRVLLATESELLALHLGGLTTLKEVHDKVFGLLDLVLGNPAARRKPESFALAVRCPGLHDADKTANAVDLVAEHIADLLESVLALLARLAGLLEFVLNAIEENVHLTVDLEQRMFHGDDGNGFEFFLRRPEREHRGG